MYPNAHMPMPSTRKMVNSLHKCSFTQLVITVFTLHLGLKVGYQHICILNILNMFTVLMYLFSIRLQQLSWVPAE